MPKIRFVLAAALVAAVVPNAAHADGQASPGVSQGWNGLADKAHGVRFVALPANDGNWTVLARITLRSRTLSFATRLDKPCGRGRLTGSTGCRVSRSARTPSAASREMDGHSCSPSRS